jgi:hypothetical protein
MGFTPPSGYVLVVATGQPPAAGSQSAVATCPVGEIAIGGGYTIYEGGQEVTAQPTDLKIQRATPDDDLTGYRVNALRSVQGWELRAIAICVYAQTG